MEQEEYSKEEINWSYIEFIDNQDVLDLIEKVFICLSCSSFSYSALFLFSKYCTTLATAVLSVFYFCGFGDGFFFNMVFVLFMV